MNEHARTALKALAAVAVGYTAERAALARILRRPDPTPVPPGWQPPGTRRTVLAADGARLHVVTAGSGPPLVLTHGVMLSMSEWALVFEPLVARGFRVIAYDHRGHGGSTVGTTGFSMANFGDDLAAVLDACDARDGLVLGHSMGGLAMLEALRRRPELAGSLAGLVLAGTTPVTYDVPGPITAAAAALVRRGAIDGLLASRLHGTLLASIGLWRGSPSAVEAVRQMLATTPRPTLAGGNATLAGCDYRPLLPGIRTPAVVLTGRQDHLIRRDSARSFRRGLPHARMVELPVGHMVPIEAPRGVIVETAALGERVGLLAR